MHINKYLKLFEDKIMLFGVWRGTKHPLTTFVHRRPKWQKETLKQLRFIYKITFLVFLFLSHWAQLDEIIVRRCQAFSSLLKKSPNPSIIYLQQVAFADPENLRPSQPCGEIIGFDIIKKQTLIHCIDNLYMLVGMHSFFS